LIAAFPAFKIVSDSSENEAGCKSGFFRYLRQPHFSVYLCPATL